MLTKTQISTWKSLTFSCTPTTYSQSWSWLVRNCIRKSKTSPQSLIKVIQEERTVNKSLKLVNPKNNLIYRLCRSKLKRCKRFWRLVLLCVLRSNLFSIHLRNSKIKPWHPKKRRNSSNPSKSCNRPSKAVLSKSSRTSARKTIQVAFMNLNLILFPILNWES